MNFRPEFDVLRFKRLRARCDVRLVEVHCETEAAVLVSRLKRRYRSGERHPGHAESAELYADLDADLARGTFGPLDVGDALIRVDTTDFESVDYEAVLTAVESASENLGR